MAKKQTLSDADMITHLWKRCRSMDSGDYFFFKNALHRVVNWYKKPLSKKQRKILVGYMATYGKNPETPKPKSKKLLNPHN